MTYLKIEKIQRDTWLVLRCSGAVDASNFTVFEAVLTKAALQPAPHIELDFELLKQMNSGALGLLLATFRHVRDRGGALRIARVSRSLKAIFDALHISRRLQGEEDDGAAGLAGL